jgi:hypothetical protein
MLNAPSFAGTYLGAGAWIVISFCIVALTVFAFEQRFRYRWVITVSAVGYLILFMLEPTPPVKAFANHEPYSLAAGLRNTALSLVLLFRLLELARWKR